MSKSVFFSHNGIDSCLKFNDLQMLKLWIINKHKILIKKKKLQTIILLKSEPQPKHSNLYGIF